MARSDPEFAVAEAERDNTCDTVQGPPSQDRLSTLCCAVLCAAGRRRMRPSFDLDRKAKPPNEVAKALSRLVLIVLLTSQWIL